MNGKLEGTLIGIKTLLKPECARRTCDNVVARRKMGKTQETPRSFGRMHRAMGKMRNGKCGTMAIGQQL